MYYFSLQGVPKMSVQTEGQFHSKTFISLSRLLLFLEESSKNDCFTNINLFTFSIRESVPD